MNTKEKYDRLILDIEERVKKPYKTAAEITKDVMASQPFTARDLNVVFQYMTGVTFPKYITERKMMVAYRSLVNGKSLQHAIAISGLGDESSFSKAFRKKFDMTPGEAARKKDETLFKEPFVWDIVSNTEMKDERLTSKQEEPEKEVIFGVPAEQYKRIMEATDLANLYEFSPTYSSIAFELSEHLNWSIQNAFEYMDGIRSFIALPWEGDPEASDEIAPDEDRLRSIAADPYFRYMYMECGVPANVAAALRDNPDFSNLETLKELDPELVNQYAQYYHYIRFGYFKVAYTYYKDHANSKYSDEDYEQYLDMIFRDVPIEEAFDAIIPFGEFMEEDAIVEDRDKWEELDSIEEMAREEEKWRNVRIDLEPDMGNWNYFE